MKARQQPVYRVQEFAKLAGVTVRALHHYDHLGLLKPRRSAAGYRLYSEGDLSRLEQIVALKFIGLPPKEVGSMLGSQAASFPDALRMQRSVLERKRRLLDRAIEVIRQAESAATDRGGPRALPRIEQDGHAVSKEGSLDEVKRSVAVEVGLVVERQSARA